MKKNSEQDKIKNALDPDNPQKIAEKNLKERRFENPTKNISFIFKFFKNLSTKAVISYIFTLAVLVFTYLFLLVVEIANIKLYIAVVVIWIFCIGAIFAIVPFVPYGVSTGRRDIMRFMAGRYIGSMFIIFMMNIAVSFGICFVLVGIIGGMLFQGDHRVASFIIKFILYLIFILVLYTLASYHGRTDTEKKVFNPHMTLQYAILANAFMLPTTRLNWHIDTELGRTLFFDAQTFLADVAFVRNLGEVGFVLGYIIISFVTCFFALIFYNMGRNSFFKKHPNQLSYDAVEVNSIIDIDKNKSGSTVDLTDLM